MAGNKKNKNGKREEIKSGRNTKRPNKYIK